MYRQLAFDNFTTWVALNLLYACAQRTSAASEIIGYRPMRLVRRVCLCGEGSVRFVHNTSRAASESHEGPTDTGRLRRTGASQYSERKGRVTGRLDALQGACGGDVGGRDGGPAGVQQ